MQESECSGKKPPVQYKEPEGLIARFFWRLWTKFTVTFALSMLESWEIALICKKAPFSFRPKQTNRFVLQVIIFGVTATLITVGLVRYTPQTIALAARRAQYYLSGSDVDVQLSMTGWSTAEKLGNTHVDL